MKKILQSATKSLSIQYPKWFFEALHLAQTQPHSIELRFSKNIATHPTGIALLTLLEQELKTLGIKLLCSPSKLLKTLHPLPRHEVDFSLDWFEPALKPMFFENFLTKQGSKISDDRAFDLKLLFSELTQNAKDHSGSERYLVYLSPDSVGVFDLGVSIPAKLAQKYPFTDDVEAIEFSLKEGITTRRLRTGGFGLNVTLDVLKRSEGELYIASRAGQIRRYLKSKRIDRKTLSPKMPGTLIHCSLDRKGKK